jgi:hypothetical protein
LTRPGSQDIILIFRGTHQVLSAEKTLKREGVAMRLVPVPRRLTSDCGLAIRISHSDRGKAREVLFLAAITPVSVHVSRPDGGYDEEAF